MQSNILCPIPIRLTYLLKIPSRLLINVGSSFNYQLLFSVEICNFFFIDSDPSTDSASTPHIRQACYIRRPPHPSQVILTYTVRYLEHIMSIFVTPFPHALLFWQARQTPTSAHRCKVWLTRISALPSDPTVTRGSTIHDRTAIRLITNSMA